MVEFFVEAIDATRLIKSMGLGVSNGIFVSNNSFNSFLAPSVWLTSVNDQNDVTSFPSTLSKYVFLAIPPFPPFVK